MMNIALILAGGVGSRVGAGIPKQFIEVYGKPVLAYTIEKFQRHPEIDAIEVVCIASYLNYMEELKEKYQFAKLRWIAEGGSSFTESVQNGIAHLQGKASEEDIVLVHFGASPFVEADLISDAIRVCREKGNAISTTPFYVLSALRDPEQPTQSGAWIDRESIACMSSPHAFRYGYISNLYRRAVETGAIYAVEPHTTTLMQYMGETIYFSKGTQSNIKITTKEDLELFRAYVMYQNSLREKQ